MRTQMFHLLKSDTLKRSVLLLIFLLLPIGFLFYQAWFNADVEFLIPSSKGQWILHAPDSVFPDKLSGTIHYRRQFRLDSVPEQCTLTVRAATQFSIFVNGSAVENNRRNATRDWKSASVYEIAPSFVAGDNIIEVRVTNMRGLPALLVESSILPKGELDLSSDTSWESTAEPDLASWRPCMLTYHERPVLGYDKSPVQRSSAYPLYVGFFAVYALFILIAVIPWRGTGVRPTPSSLSSVTPGNPNACPAVGCPADSRRAYGFILILIITAVLLLNVHNVLVYPHSRSYFDWEGHVAYIKYMASNWRVPVATQGWQMYQPPLYYFLSAIVYTLLGGLQGEPASLKAVQFVGMLSGLLIILIAWLALRMIAKGNRKIELLGLGAVAFLPMALYMYPTISNEVFSAALISLSMLLLMKFGFQDAISIRQAILLGVVVGLALLSKYTALLIFLVAIGVLLIRLKKGLMPRRREIAILVVFVVAVIACCGWFYVRNIVLFQNPFIGNWDVESGFYYEQPPGYRTLGFYTRFGSVFTHAPERSRWSSFWDAYYGSMWMDSHFNMLDHRDESASSHGSVILCLALLPSVALLAGLGICLKRLMTGRMFESVFVLVAASVVTVFSFIWFTMRLPYITTLKAFFSLSLLPAFAVFLGLGLHKMEKNLGKFAPLLYLSLTVLLAYVYYLFWYSGT